MTITKEMTIGEVIQQHPQCVEILLSEGVHCVGCGAAYWETIEQGLVGHGKPPEEVERIVNDLNRAVSLASAEKIEGEITITDAVVAKLKHIMQKQNKEGFGLRIDITNGGCAGFQYHFSLQEHAKSNDKIIEKDNIKVFLDEAAQEKLKDSTVDYVEGLASSGFRITNPTAKKTCGCGQSFQ